MYVVGMVLAVLEANRQAYRVWAERSAAFFRDYGCIEIVEAWEDNVPDGKVTDFRKAVAAEPGERIVFSWQVWPSRAFLDIAEERMHADPRMEIAGEIPFDARRIILGGFAPLAMMGRD